MMCKTMNSLFKLDQNAKQEGKTESFTNSNARPGRSQTTIYVPGSRKHTEVDVHIDTNLTIPGFKDARFFSCCSVIICILSFLVLILAIGYQNSELCVMEHNIVVLNQQVELLAVASDRLRQSVVDLQNRVNGLMHKHHSTAKYVVRGISASVQDMGHARDAMDNVSSPGFETVQENNFDSLYLDHESNTNVSLKDTLIMGNVMDVENRSLYSTAENSNPISTDTLLYNKSVDIYGSIFTDDNETSSRLQEFKVKNISDSSLPGVIDIPHSEDGSLSIEDSMTEEGVRLGRVKRSNRRGNEKSSGGRRGHLNKKRNIRGPSLVHFRGAVPEAYIEDGGLIAPWHADEHGAGDFLLSKFQLREGKGAVEVTEKGLYYIYAQVYYLTTESSNSFSINLREEGKSSTEELALCSGNAPGNGKTSEVSCFTSVVRFLNATDRIYIRQRERNRRMILRDGFSFFGLVFLNGQNGRRG